MNDFIYFLKNTPSIHPKGQNTSILKQKSPLDLTQISSQKLLTISTWRRIWYCKKKPSRMDGFYKTL